MERGREGKRKTQNQYIIACPPRRRRRPLSPAVAASLPYNYQTIKILQTSADKFSLLKAGLRQSVYTARIHTSTSLAKG